MMMLDLLRASVDSMLHSLSVVNTYTSITATTTTSNPGPYSFMAGIFRGRHFSERSSSYGPEVRTALRQDLMAIKSFRGGGKGEH